MIDLGGTTRTKVFNGVHKIYWNMHEAVGWGRENFFDTEIGGGKDFFLVQIGGQRFVPQKNLGD